LLWKTHLASHAWGVETDIVTSPLKIANLAPRIVECAHHVLKDVETMFAKKEKALVAVPRTVEFAV